MLTFPKYGSYRDSDIAWIGNIPSHWTIAPGLTCYEKRKELNTGMVEDTVLSISYGRIVIRPPEKLTGLVPESFETYQLVDPGDIIIRPTDLQNDWNTLRTAIARDRGIITSAYLRLKAIGDMNPEYLRLVLHTYDLLKVYYGMGSGLRQNLDYNGDFKRLPIIVPPRTEQDRIVAFLDSKTREIDDAIAKKQRLIELLQEQKAILINNAVTKGLDPDLPMRESGVKWIGRVPAHWEVCALGYLARLETGATPDRSKPGYWNGTIPWIKTGEIRYNLINEAEEFITESGLRNSATRLSPPGTILMAMYGQGVTRGRVAILGIEATYNQACLAVSPNRKVFNLYLYYFMIAAYDFIRDFGNETSQMNLNSGIISKIRILIPDMDEQIAIVSHIKDIEHKFDEVIPKEIKTIKLLLELKQSIISEAVTGKIRI